MNLRKSMASFRIFTGRSGADGRAFAPVALVNVLDHLFAPFVFEIDIDIRRLVTVRRDETGEEQLAFVRIDLGDAEAIANSAIRC